jgi:alpha-L-rhamnosidase
MKKIVFLVLISINLFAQNKNWNAQWIKYPNTKDQELGVFHFRKTIELSEKPSKFIIHISADNRYKFYVNGEIVSLGPSRSDVINWNFETVDISKLLKHGKNTLAALVWQFADEKPMAQMSFKTGLIVQGDTEFEEIANTNNSWKCLKNSSYEFKQPQMTYVYYVVGPEESLDMNQYPQGWETKNYDDSKWINAQNIGKGQLKSKADWTEGPLLTPRIIPQMLRDEVSYKKVRSSKGMKVPPDFPYEWARLDVPANSKVEIIIDQEELVNAYPAFEMNRGKDAIVSMQFLESFYLDEKTDNWKNEKNKPNRNLVQENFRAVGPKDKVISNGQKDQLWESLWYRTFRYIKLEIETKEEALAITNFRAIKTGYPFELKAKFSSDNKDINKMLDIGWRTAQLCATETYMDCPYYEQLQYVGDTRIQALISYYNAGDDRLAKNAILHFNQSKLAEGITQSRFPSYIHQEIPPFSLWWISMVHDFYRYRNDVDFVKDQLSASRNILEWFFRLQNPDGTLKKVPYWNFSDWSIDPDWQAGRAPSTDKGESSVLDFQLLLALQNAYDLEFKIGSKAIASVYLSKIKLLQSSIKAKYFDIQKGIFSDTPEWKHYSQHPNVLAILTNTVSGDAAKKLMKLSLEDPELMPCSIYFKYYLHQAIQKTGLMTDYLSHLEVWQLAMKEGLSTWPEMTDPSKSRSDCHAWSAHPNIEFYRIVLGIDTDGPGFSKVKIAPILGKLNHASGSVPHPNGEISVEYKLEANKMMASINLPKGVTGKFEYKGKTIVLKSGENKITI